MGESEIAVLVYILEPLRYSVSVCSQWPLPSEKWSKPKKSLPNDCQSEQGKTSGGGRLIQNFHFTELVYDPN